jgi:hypothetical protein
MLVPRLRFGLVLRRQLLFVLVAIVPSLGASYPTTNFLVEAPTPQIAQRIGQMAEYYRKEKALLWLGREMPPWQERCPLHVRVTMGGAGGATSFNFTHGQIWQTMEIEGSLDRLLASVLPHEVTHTVFAHYFRCPVPRWADEGGAVLSEDDLEQSRHDAMVRQILNAGKAIPLHRLFTLRDYPREVGALYAEGYSVADFLVASSNRQVFLAFVAQGMQYGWDSAVQTHYRYRSIDQLELAWINYLRAGKHRPSTLLAENTAQTTAEPAKRVIVRLTAPPVQPLQDTPQPIVRGQAPEYDSNERYVESARQPFASRPGYLPDFHGNPGTVAPGMDRNQRVPQDPWQPARARLGPPQFDVPPPPPGASPVGYPR